MCNGRTRGFCWNYGDEGAIADEGPIDGVGAGALERYGATALRRYGASARVTLPRSTSRRMICRTRSGSSKMGLCADSWNE
jgi:hypothetical protein